MTKTISKNISGLIMITGLALVIISCQKEVSVGTNAANVEAGLTLKEASPALNSSTCAAIPGDIKVPDGNKFVLQAFARGFQIYEVKRSTTDPTVFSWVNIAPLADLYASPNFTNQVIEHFAGPSWEFIKGPEKGEKVVAARDKGITMDASAIQWLLLKTVDDLSTPGNKITYIQRVCTVGGLAPTTGADEAHLGQRDSIPYTASYLFYTKE